MMLVVTIRTDDFTAKAMHYSEFPWQRVVALQTEPRPDLAVGLLRDALFENSDRERLDGLSYRQLLHAVDAYLSAKPKPSNIYSMS